MLHSDETGSRAYKKILYLERPVVISEEGIQSQKAHKGEVTQHLVEGMKTKFPHHLIRIPSLCGHLRGG